MNDRVVLVVTTIQNLALSQAGSFTEKQQIQRWISASQIHSGT